MPLHVANMKSGLNIAILLHAWLLFTETVYCQAGNLRHSRQAGTGTNSDEDQAIMFLEEYNRRAQVEYYEEQVAYWAFDTDFTEENQQRLVSVITAYFQDSFTQVWT